MRAYPIWNDVTACNYASSRSWGSRDTMTLNQYVGSSAKNSYHFAEIVTRRTVRDGKVRFTLYVDGNPIKVQEFTEKNGRAVEPC